MALLRFMKYFSLHNCKYPQHSQRICKGMVDKRINMAQRDRIEYMDRLSWELFWYSHSLLGELPIEELSIIHDDEK